jgi:dimethylhistidine N-methyltransferase
MKTFPRLRVRDSSSQRAAFRSDVLFGLRQSAKRIPCKYFYDERGSRLFDQICELEEYYPTRSELAILDRHVGEMAARIGPGSQLIEFGSGSSIKTRLLLDQLPSAAAYVPVDISREHLLRSAQAIRRAYPRLKVVPLAVDFTESFCLPDDVAASGRRVVYFPGSTIGNFGPAEAQALLRRIAHLCGPGGGLLIGVDVKKDPAILVPAYNDRLGVTAAFNLNVLARINRELGGDFDLGAFRHRAVFDEGHGRIEMYLVSQREQTAHVGGECFRFASGEAICTEYSYKYSLEDFARLAASAGFRAAQVWEDDRRLFSVQYLDVV